MQNKHGQIGGKHDIFFPVNETAYQRYKMKYISLPGNDDVIVISWLDAEPGDGDDLSRVQIVLSHAETSATVSTRHMSPIVSWSPVTLSPVTPANSRRTSKEVDTKFVRPSIAGDIYSSY